MENLIDYEKAERFVQKIDKNLSPKLFFHSWQHTADVIDTVVKIGSYYQLNAQSLLLLKLAALFHDTGYLRNYTGHEDDSISIAQNFLSENGMSPILQMTVLDCIAATKIPQQPKGLLAEILCDADLAHFAKDNYLDYASRLRKEWVEMLNKVYTDRQWNEENLALLLKHQYKTTYGQIYLQPLKEKQIDIIRKKLN